MSWKKLEMQLHVLFLKTSNCLALSVIQEQMAQIVKGWIQLGTTSIMKYMEESNKRP